MMIRGWGTTTVVPPRAKCGGYDTWGSSIMRMECWSAPALLDEIHAATAAQKTNFRSHPPHGRKNRVIALRSLKITRGARPHE